MSAQPNPKETGTPRLIPIYEPLLGEPEKRNVARAMESGWISSRGEFLEQFECGFAERIGIPHVTSCTNGTVALHLAFLALGIGAGDEVIVPDFSYVACANTVVHAGATPVFCDVDASTWQISLSSAAARITPRTKAIMAVHTYGGVVPMAELRALADTHGLKIIEDCAEAIGSLYRGEHVGRMGDIATFSFFGNKTITTGEGGMVASTSLELMKLIRRLKNQGVAEGHRYHHDLVAYNYRMTNVACAIGCAQLERWDDILAAKKTLWTRYVTGLANTPLMAQHFTAETTPSHWLCCFRMPEGQAPAALMQFLAERHIETRPGFGVLSEMPMYKKTDLGHSTARLLADSVICLPSYPSLEAQKQDRIIEAITMYFRS